MKGNEVEGHVEPYDEEARSAKLLVITKKTQSLSLKRSLNIVIKYFLYLNFFL